MKEFMDEYIFNEFKDTPLNGTHNFVKKVKDKYDMIPDSALYRKIVNYQIREYGMTLFNHRPSYKKGTSNYKCRHRNSLKIYSSINSFIFHTFQLQYNNIL